MNLEALVSSVLSGFLGRYVEGFDPANLDISLMKGEATISGLRLKSDVLEDFDLPITVKQGYLGRVHLKIPWLNLGRLLTESAVIQISDIFILAGPDPGGHDREKEKHREHNTKMASLALATQMGLDKPDGVQQTEPTPTFGVVEELGAKILDNLQVFVDNIHFRYEDNAGSESIPFAVGALIQSIHLQSTDENWIPKFIDITKRATIFKTASLKNLCVYFDQNAPPIAYSNIETFAQKMRDIITQGTGNHTQKFPSLEIRANINIGPSDLSRPRTILNVVVDEMTGGLDSVQYKGVNDFVSWATRLGNKLKHKTSVPRPTRSPEQDPLLGGIFSLFLFQNWLRNKISNGIGTG